MVLSAEGSGGFGGSSLVGERKVWIRDGVGYIFTVHGWRPPMRVVSSAKMIGQQLELAGLRLLVQDKRERGSSDSAGGWNRVVGGGDFF